MKKFLFYARVVKAAVVMVLYSLWSTAVQWGDEVADQAVLAATGPGKFGVQKTLAYMREDWRGFSSCMRTSWGITADVLRKLRALRWEDHAEE